MTKVSEFISQLAETGKVKESATVKAILSAPITSDTELPAEFTDAFNTSYLTLNGAKNNAEVKTFFYGAALSSADTKIKSVMDVLGFSDEQKKQINEIDGTYKRIDEFGKVAKGILSNASANTDKKKFVDEIADLNNKIVLKDSEITTKVKEANDKWTGRLATIALSQKFLEKPLFTSDTQDISDTLLLANNKFQKALSEKGADLIFDSETLTFKLVQKKNPDLAYTESNKEVSFNDFRDKVLAESKLLKVTSTSTAVQNGNGNSHSQTDVKPSMRDITFNKNISEDMENFKQSQPAS